MFRRFSKGFTTLVLAGLLLLFCSTASAQEEVTIVDSGSCGTNVTWQLDSQGVLTILGDGKMADYQSKSTLPPWNYINYKIQTVVIEEGITSLGQYSFYNCYNLTKVSFPFTLTTIGGYAFENCTSLSELLFSKGLITIGTYAFSGCSSLTTVDLPDTVTTIGTYAFYCCTSLNSVSIPDSITSLGNQAFIGCNAISVVNAETLDGWVNIPFSSQSANPLCYGADLYINGEPVTKVGFSEGTTAVGAYAFSGCNSLTEVEFPSSVLAIEDYAFYECVNLKSAALSHGINSIGRYAFDGCSSLEVVVIPDSATSIGLNAFANCTGLVEAVIPNSVTSLGNSMFRYCSSLGSVVLPDHISRIGNWMFEGCSSLTEIQIPEGVTAIGNSAFKDCSGLTTITLPPNLVSIDYSAFAGCSNLQKVHTPSLESWMNITFSSLESNPMSYGDELLVEGKKLREADIPDGTSKIGAYQFYNCADLKEVTIPQSVESIRIHAFDGCSNLTSVIVPEKVISISECAFFGCSSLLNVELRGNITSIGRSAFANCVSLANIELPSTVEVINAYAFASCSSLKSICIPVATSSIEDYAFKNCSLLASVSLSSGLTTIGLSVFQDCISLNEFTIPNSVSTIGNYAFNNCSSLTEIVIPSSVTSLGFGAFHGCNNLTYVTVPACVVSGNQYVTDSANTFRGYFDTTVQSVKVAEGVKLIGNCAFYECTGLKNIQIPTSVTTIGYRAFESCAALTSITIPASVVSIGYLAFHGCNQLKHVALLGETANASIPSSAIIYCYEYSEADFWATENGYTTVYLDNMDTNEPTTFTLLLNNSRIKVGSSVSIIPVVFPMQDNPTIQWISSHPEVASVADGTITALCAGEAIITATCGGVSASVNITVYTFAESFDLSSEEIWMVAKEEQTLLIENISPSESETRFDVNGFDTELVSVTMSTNSDHVLLNITGKRPGETVISVTDQNSGILRKCMVHVCYPVISIAFDQESYELSIDTKSQLSANVTTRTQSFVNKLVTFKSSDETIVSVDSDGFIQALNYGNVEITATANSGVTAVCSVSVVCNAHEPIITPGVSATCTEPGLTEGKHCSVCNEVLVAQDIIPAMGHTICFNQNIYNVSVGKASDVISYSVTCGHSVDLLANAPQQLTLTSWNGSAVTIVGNEPGVATLIFEVDDEFQNSASCKVVIHAAEQMLLPSALTVIDEEAFANLKTEEFVLSHKVQSVGARAFANCENLVLINLPDGIQIADSAFDGCEQLTILCSEGSTGHTYAAEHEIPYLILPSASADTE